MDTILKPRHLSETESDDSLHVHSNSMLKLHDEIGSGSNNDDENIVFYPTARYLQVNSKKISSYDLLVRPPKQARLASAESLEKPQAPATLTQDDKVELECIHFENETRSFSSKESCGDGENTGFHRTEGLVTGQGETSSINCYEDRKLSEDFNNNEGSPIITLPLLLNMVPNISNISQRVESISKGISAFHRKNERVSQSHPYLSKASCKTTYGIVNERDENKNYLPNRTAPHSQASCGLKKPSSCLQSIQSKQLPPPPPMSNARSFKSPFYRLGRTHEAERTQVFLKENDYNSSAEDTQIFPSTKRLKYTEETDGGSNDEQEANDADTGDENEKVTFLLICNECSKESAILSSIGETPIMSEQLFSSHSEANESLMGQQSTSGGAIVNHESEQGVPELTSIVFDQAMAEQVFVEPENGPPDENDCPFTSSYVNFSYPTPFMQDMSFQNFGMFPESGGDTRSGDSNDDKESMSHHSPFSRFIEDLLGCNGSRPNFSMNDADSFIMGRLSSPESESRIEDVTEELADDAEVQISNVESKPVNTIMHSRDPTFLRKESASCQLVEGLFNSNNEFRPGYQDQNRFDERFGLEGEDHEFLMQPKTNIKYSNSIQSLLEPGETAFKSSTTDKIIEKATKSDYFVGKVAGLSKSVMKTYKKLVRTPSKIVITCESTSSCASQMNARDTENLNKNEERKEASPTLEKSKSKDRLPPPALGQDINHNVEVGTTEVISNNNSNSMAAAASQSKTSHSSVKKVLTTCYRKVSSGNRISVSRDDISSPFKNNLNRDNPKIEDASDKHKGGSKEKSLAKSAKRLSQKRPLKHDSIQSSKTVSEKGGGAIASPTTLLLRSSSSSSVVIKNNYLKKVSEKKAKDQLDSNSNIVKRITRLFMRTKKTRNTSDVNVNITVPSRTLAQHTDSVELYREKRYKFFRELKEFQGDSLRAYFQILMEGPMQDSVLSSKDNLSSFASTISESEKPSGNGSRINLPYTTAIPVVQCLQATGSLESDPPIPIPARIAVSDSAIPTLQSRSLSHNLVLQCPPIFQMLALTAQTKYKKPGPGGSYDRFRRPFKGILKRKTDNKK